MPGALHVPIQRLALRVAGDGLETAGAPVALLMCPGLDTYDLRLLVTIDDAASAYESGLTLTQILRPLCQIWPTQPICKRLYRSQPRRGATIA